MTKSDTYGKLVNICPRPTVGPPRGAGAKVFDQISTWKEVLIMKPAPTPVRPPAKGKGKQVKRFLDNEVIYHCQYLHLA